MARKTQKLSTLLVFVQDETGSMSAIEMKTISAFNEYFGTLKEEATGDGEVSVQLWQFSEAPGEERVRPFFSGGLKDVPMLTQENYRPRGVTPLLDAVGTAIAQAERQQADRYLFIVQTDGLENASRDFTREQVERIVAAKEEDERWTLVFLGTGISQWAEEAAAMGVAASSTTAYDPDSTRFAHRAMSQKSLDFLASSDLSRKRMAREIEREVSEKRRRAEPDVDAGS